MAEQTDTAPGETQAPQIGALAEALDCVTYAWAARHVVAIDLDRRENELRQVIPATTSPTRVPSPWVSAW